MGLPFHFAAGEGPVIEKPLRTAEDVALLRTDRAAELGYVADAVALVAKHFGTKLPIIGFCGAPFTLASYMVEGGGSRHYLEVKKLMYNSPEVWDELVAKLVDVLAAYAANRYGPAPMPCRFSTVGWAVLALRIIAVTCSCPPRNLCSACKWNARSPSFILVRTAQPCCPRWRKQGPQSLDWIGAFL